jgi:HEAT repeat protein
MKILNELFNDKNRKAKQRTEELCELLIRGIIAPDDLIEFAAGSKDPVKGSCIEAFEFATRNNPDFGDQKILDFAIQSLSEKAPRVKWESAKVIGNMASRFPKKMAEAVPLLMRNSSHEGTVVRWSAAFALCEILKSGYNGKTPLINELERIYDREEQNGVRQIYAKAFKKMN